MEAYTALEQVNSIRKNRGEIHNNDSDAANEAIMPLVPSGSHGRAAIGRVQQGGRMILE